MTVYPLSGQYGLLPRFLFYALMGFSVAGHARFWLVAGALASAMTYSGTAVIHALILASDSAHSLYDIDTVGIWAIVSVGSLMVFPVLHSSNTIARLPSRLIFGFWGSLVSFGAIFAIVALWRDYPSEPECRSSNGTLLTSIARHVEDFNCTYSCFGAKQILQAPTDIAIVSQQQVFGWSMNLMVVSMIYTTVFGIYFGVMGCWLIPRKRTEAELRAIIARSNDGLTPKWRRPGVDRVEAARTELASGEMNPRECEVEYFYPVLVISVIVMNEVYLLKHGGLPTTENVYAIGQWGPWVGVALTLLAAAIVRYNLPKFLERQKILDAERDAFEMRTMANRNPMAASEIEHEVPFPESSEHEGPTCATNSAPSETSTSGVGQGPGRDQATPEETITDQGRELFSMKRRRTM